MGKKLLVLDPGHLMKDSGAVDGIGPQDSINSVESWINKDIVKRVAALLSPHFIVKITTDLTKDFSPRGRADIINRLKPALFVSIHCNAAGNPKARGVEAWVKDLSSPVFGLANEVVKDLAVNISTVDRGIKVISQRPQTITILKEANFPGFLLEMGFISNPKEEKEIHAKKDLIAASIATNIINWGRVK